MIWIGFPLAVGLALLFIKPGKKAQVTVHSFHSDVRIKDKRTLLFLMMFYVRRLVFIISIFAL